MKEILCIGNETFLLQETTTGYRLKSFADSSVHECENGKLNETIYRLIDLICGK